MMNEILCLNPKYILHPKIGEYLCRYHHYFLDGVYNYYRPRRRGLYEDFNKRFNPHTFKINHDNIDKYYVLDAGTGETFNIFLEVPCGHCDNCKLTKVNSFVQRCTLETLCYTSLPWFLTLTYRDSNLPDAGSLCVRDVQLFLKRLRINLQRRGFTNNIRYVCVGEYGKKTHRPHYHMILWNLPDSGHVGFFHEMLADIINSSWNQGFISYRVINPQDDKGFYYTSKYLKKDNVVPVGCAKNFMNSSTRHGGIGAHYIDKEIAPYLRRSVKLDAVSKLRPIPSSFLFKNFFKGSVEQLQFSSYVLNRVFPSFCRSVSSEARKNLHQFCLAYSSYLSYTPFKGKSLLHDYYAQKYSTYNSYFSKYVYMGLVPFDELKFADGYTFESAQSDMTQLIPLLDDYLSKGVDLDQCMELHNKRGIFLSNLFQYTTPIDKNARAEKAQKMFARSKSLEKF